MSLTNRQIREAKRHRWLLKNNPGVHPNMREYIDELETVLGPDGEDIFPTTTTTTSSTSTTTSTSSSTSTSTSSSSSSSTASTASTASTVSTSTSSSSTTAPG